MPAFQLNIDNVPELICGPILRRVEALSVSVFVVMKSQHQVTLTIYEGNDGNIARAYVAQTSADTIQFGAYFHALVITAELTEASKLKEGKLYGYSLRFIKGVELKDLSLDMLGTDLPLGYGRGKLPAFMLPPSDFNTLKLIHASCRKPHGERRDMTPAMDTVIRENYEDVTKRPHQLFLTGDQIYADDVSDLMLTMLTPIGDTLLGWTPNETVPVGNGKLKPVTELPPGRRQTLVADEAAFTSNAAKSHLLSFGEFIAMYLMVWSDVLYPATLPDFKSVYPDSAARYEASPNDPPQDVELERSQFKLITLPAIEQFRRGLAKVRRLLANIPTYMIFDDHEITDDWYINYKVFTGTRASALGKRVITNALSAYAIFQGWGNTPTEFSRNQRGGILLDYLSHRNGDTNTKHKNTNVYGELVRRLVETTDDADRMRWDYVVDAANYRVLVLDTRTRREYVGQTSNPNVPPNLMSEAEIDRQISQKRRENVPITILVSPTPVFGSPLPETIQAAFGKGSRLGTVPSNDIETWRVDGRPRIFERLLDALVPFGRVLILSGDVHYGFTLQVRYWKELKPPQPAAFVQLCASSLKNEITKTRILGKVGWIEGLAALDQAYLGWQTPGEHLRNSNGDLIEVSGSPAVISIPVSNADFEVKAPDWRYRIQFSFDARTEEARGLSRLPAQTGSPTSQRKLLNEAFTQRRSSQLGQMRIVVGYNNFGVVTFSIDPADAPSQYIVFQELYYRQNEDSAPSSYTSHTANLTVPLPDEFKPRPSAATVDLPTLTRWSSLISFIPAHASQVALRAIVPANPWYFHRIERGYGEINLDYYPVLVTKLPKQIPGNTKPSAQDVFEYFRQELNLFLDQSVAIFSPFPEYRAPNVLVTDQSAKWQSPTPIDTLCTFQIKVGGIPVDSGSVVCTYFDEQSWIFSTAYTERDLGHPVSGNRMFAFEDFGANQYIFYTLGADRTTSLLDYAAAQDVFKGADKLWRSMQLKLVDFVKVNEGEAETTVEQTFSERFDWNEVLAKYCNQDRSQWL